MCDQRQHQQCAQLCHMHGTQARKGKIFVLWFFLVVLKRTREMCVCVCRLSLLSRAPHTKIRIGQSIHQFRIECKNGRNFLFFPSLNILFLYTRKNFQFKENRIDKKKKNKYSIVILFSHLFHGVSVHPNKSNQPRKTNANAAIAFVFEPLTKKKKNIYWNLWPTHKKKKEDRKK